MAKELPLIAKIFDPKMFVYDFIKWTGAWLPFITVRHKTIFVTKEKRKVFKGKYLISANHSSFSDPVIISTVFWRRRICFVATSELFNTKAKNRFFKAIRCIEVDKQNVSMKTFKEVKDTLHRGHIVGVFPEGTVDVDSPEHKVYKSGIVMMAIMGEADILPTYIKPRKSSLNRQVVYIGEKIHIKDHIKSVIPTMEDIANVTKLVQEKENELAELANQE